MRRGLFLGRSCLVTLGSCLDRPAQILPKCATCMLPPAWEILMGHDGPLNVAESAHATARGSSTCNQSLFKWTRKSLGSPVLPSLKQPLLRVQGGTKNLMYGVLCCRLVLATPVVFDIFLSRRPKHLNPSDFPTRSACWI